MTQSEYIQNGDVVLVHVHNSLWNGLFERLGSPVPDRLRVRLSQQTPLFRGDKTLPELVWPDDNNTESDTLVTGGHVCAVLVRIVLTWRIYTSKLDVLKYHWINHQSRLDNR
jgi:hypothetical protein